MCFGGAASVWRNSKIWPVLQQNKVEKLLLFSGFSRVNAEIARHFGMTIKRSYVSAAEGVSLSLTQLEWILADIHDCVDQKWQGTPSVACVGLAEAIVPTVAACYLLKCQQCTSPEEAIKHVTFALPKLAVMLNEALVKMYFLQGLVKN